MKKRLKIPREHLLSCFFILSLFLTHSLTLYLSLSNPAQPLCSSVSRFIYHQHELIILLCLRECARMSSCVNMCVCERVRERELCACARMSETLTFSLCFLTWLYVYTYLHSRYNRSHTSCPKKTRPFCFITRFLDFCLLLLEAYCIFISCFIVDQLDTAAYGCSCSYALKQMFNVPRYWVRTLFGARIFSFPFSLRFPFMPPLWHRFGSSLLMLWNFIFEWKPRSAKSCLWSNKLS